MSERKGRMVYFSGTCKPSAMFKRLKAHQGDLSIGDLGEILAERTILNRKVIFYRNGDHKVLTKGISDEESFNSEVLRFAHASILINQPVGDKKIHWVDATKDPVEVWLFNMPAERFLMRSKMAIVEGIVTDEFILDQDFNRSKEVILP